MTVRDSQGMSEITYNILSRPKRSIHSQRLVITEEIAQMYGIESTSESDEDFVPNEKSKSENGSADNNDDDGDNIDEDDSADDNSRDSQTQNKASTLSEEKKPKKRAISKAVAAKIPKSKKITEDEKKKPKRKYKKTKMNRLNQIKNEEYINENKKLLDKFTSKSAAVNPKLPNTGPCVKYNRVIDESMGLRTFVVCNNQRVNANEDVAGGDTTLIKIPKDKIEMQLKNPNGTWLCKLCHGRPNHFCLGNIFQ